MINKQQVSYRGIRRGLSWHCSFVFLLLLLISGCGVSKRTMTTVESTGLLSRGEFLRSYQEQKEVDVVDAKGYVSALFDGQEVEVGTRWSLRRDQDFVLSLRILGLMEAGRLTVTGDNMTVLDRMGKRGLTLDNLSKTIAQELKVYNIDPRILTALVHHRPFSNKLIGGDALKGMDFSIDLRRSVYTFEDRRSRIKHEFDRDLNLNYSEVRLSGGELISIGYSDFVELSPQKRPYPKSITLTVLHGDGHRVIAKVQFGLENISTRFSQRVETSIPVGYKKMTIEQLTDLIIDLNK